MPKSAVFLFSNTKYIEYTYKYFTAKDIFTLMKHFLSKYNYKQSKTFLIA